jgi:hypothetical protein
MNNIEDIILNKYYNIPEFEEANNLYEKFLETCEITTDEVENFSEFKISTITSIIRISTFLNLKVLFENIDINENIAYIEFKNQIKGKKDKKKTKKKNNDNDKRKRNKGKTFANQLSIGFLCKIHHHKKPICVKIFSKGSLTITGTKSYDEIKRICNQLLDIFLNINIKYKFNDREIILIPYKNLVQKKNISINIETVNGSFKTNYRINLRDLKKKVREFYTPDKIYIKSNRAALLELDLKIHGFFDKRKNKLKTPKISIYGTGSIVINSINQDLLLKAFNFIKEFLLKYQKDVIDKNYVFNL